MKNQITPGSLLLHYQDRGKNNWVSVTIISEVNNLAELSTLILGKVPGSNENLIDLEEVDEGRGEVSTLIVMPPGRWHKIDGEYFLPAPKFDFGILELEGEVLELPWKDYLIP